MNNPKIRTVSLLLAAFVLALWSVSSPAAAETGKIELRGERIELRHPSGVAELTTEGRERAVDSRLHIVLAFPPNTAQSDLNALEDAGVELLHKIPRYPAFIASVPRDALSVIGGLRVVEGWADVPARSKLDYKGRKLLDRGEMEKVTEADVIFYRDVSKESRTELLKAVGIAESAVTRRGSGNRIRVTAPFGRLVDLAGMDGVQTVWTDVRPKQLHNENARDTSNADEVQPGGASGYGVTGNGIEVGIWDGGPVLDTHEQFQPGSRVVVAQGSGSHRHATHVGCTIIGDGDPDSAAMGLATSATLESFDFFGDVFTEMDNNAGSYAASNHSWGFISGWQMTATCTSGVLEWVWYGDDCNDTEDSRFGKYGANSSTADGVAVDKPHFLIVKSAGNDRDDGPGTQPFNRYVSSSSCEECTNTPPGIDGNPDGSGYDTISDWGNAKNIVTVGAINDIVTDPVQGSDIALTSFSSYGPADDGRVKPDLVANGSSLYSAYNNSDDSYGYMSGTSMSSPVVTGIVALLAEFYSTNNSGRLPNASLLKAILINTAIDDADPRDGPDYRIGWGLANARAAADLMNAHYTSGNLRWVEGSYQGTEISENVAVGANEAFTVTLVWTDPAGLANTSGLDDNTPALVNDLDLTLESPSGTIYRPWVLDPANPGAAAVRSDNHVDNVEQIDVPAADAEQGQWTVRIGHTGLLEGNAQAFSLVVGPGADLGPSSLARINRLWPVEGAGCGEDVTLWAEVQNLDGSDLPSGTKVWFWVNGPGWSGSHWVGAANAGGLAADETRWYSFDWSVPNDLSAGSYAYYAQVWYDGEAVSEWSDRQAFDLECPEASVTSLWRVDGAKCGEDAVLWAQIENTGETALPSGAKVWFWVNGSGWSGSNWVGAADAGGLAAGDTRWYSFDWSVPSDLSSGSYNYYAQVWYGGQAVSGWSEKRTFDVSCIKVSISSLWPVSGAACGESSNLWALVKNTGEKALPSGLNVWFWVDGPNWSGSHWVGRAGVSSLGAGESEWYSFEWPIPDDASAGSYNYWGQVWHESEAVSDWSAKESFSLTCP